MLLQAIDYAVLRSLPVWPCGVEARDLAEDILGADGRPEIIAVHESLKRLRRELQGVIHESGAGRAVEYSVDKRSMERVRGILA